MQIPIPFFNRMLTIEWSQRAKPFKIASAEKACDALMEKAWAELALDCDMAPEYLERSGFQVIGPFLRGALKGCAIAISDGKQNPMREFWIKQAPWQSPRVSFSWRQLGKRVISSRAIEPTDPFYFARLHTRLDERHPSVESDGDFCIVAQKVLNQLDTEKLAQAADQLG